jgi:hypothetical protein
MAVDWESGYIFVTYEFSDTLEILDARTMVDVGNASAPGAENLAGIVYDETKDLLYTVDRGTDKLYVYTWDAGTGKLHLSPGAPFTLEGSTAYGIDLDEARGLLYTASGNRTIRVYNGLLVPCSTIEPIDRQCASPGLSITSLIYTAGILWRPR